ncbi:uncharacterized protein FTOL_07118 [Fusarium torulosum]|uniref:Uncharacterized protein n=1 Tax=Fusarium torulosum TaxID=33205 RepID=A0AAE8SJE7_9HYPO|nr:uncharacterized protein FTOL_07118 [Fusarium torulosum]
MAFGILWKDPAATSPFYTWYLCTTRRLESKYYSSATLVYIGTSLKASTSSPPLQSPSVATSFGAELLDSSISEASTG